MSIDPTPKNVENISLGPVHLEIRDKSSTIRFWEDVIGLKVLNERDGVEMGVDAKTLVVLHPNAEKPFSDGYSGLYHLAIHLPDEGEFARVLARLMMRGYPHSPTDHIMSKALYLVDPDGITIEITLETPDRFDHYNILSDNIEVIDADGRKRGITERLDVSEVLTKLPDKDLEKLMPTGTKIGHMHMYVGDLLKAYDFYKSLGFEENLFSADFGFGDLSAGGIFKHRIAMNTWQGLGAPQSPKGIAGMRHFTIIYATKELLAEVVKSTHAKSLNEKEYEVKDPSGNKILLTS